MKKIFFGLLLGLFLCSASSQAGTLKNFYAYKIIGHNINEVVPIAQSYIETLKDNNSHKLNSVSNAWYYTNEKNNSTIYYRFYKANKNTNLFVVANKTYDKYNNNFTKFCRINGYRCVPEFDKEAIKEYKYDFYDILRKENLGNFFVTPDCVKPLKFTIKKINDKLAQYNKNNTAIPYSVDKDSIDLTLLDSNSKVYNEYGIKMKVNEYRLKNKENKYVHAFEYLIKNNSNSNLLLKSVNSERIASMKDIATETFIDIDRLSILGTIGTFRPVLICSCGTSILLSVPNWVRLFKTTKEASRYAKELPNNCNINPNETIRILVMKYKNNEKPLNFDFIRNNETYKISM